jgi:hypothetical protein
VDRVVSSGLGADPDHAPPAMIAHADTIRGGFNP